MRNWILAIFYTDGDFIQTFVGPESRILNIINHKCVINGQKFTDVDDIGAFLTDHFDSGEFVFDPEIRFTISEMNGDQYVVW